MSHGSQTTTFILNTHKRLTTIPISCERKSSWFRMYQLSQMSSKPWTKSCNPFLTQQRWCRSTIKKRPWMQLVNWLYINLHTHKFTWHTYKSWFKAYASDFERSIFIYLVNQLALQSTNISFCSAKSSTGKKQRLKHVAYAKTICLVENKACI